MEEWQELEDDESEEEIIPEPDREDKLQTYLQLAAAGHSPIDYVRETSGLPIEDRSFLLEPPDSASEIFTQEEASVEVDALGDEVEESEPVAHPGHRSRSLDLIKSHSYPSSSSIFDPPDLADDNDSREDVDENDENANPLLPLADLPEDTPVASHAERHGELRAIADVEQGTDFPRRCQVRRKTGSRMPWSSPSRRPPRTPRVTPRRMPSWPREWSWRHATTMRTMSTLSTIRGGVGACPRSSRPRPEKLTCERRQ